KMIILALFSLCFLSATGQGKSVLQKDTEMLNTIVHQYLDQSDSLDRIEAIVIATDLELFEYSAAYTFLDDMPQLEIFSVNGSRLKTPKIDVNGKEYSCLNITYENQNVVLR